MQLALFVIIGLIAVYLGFFCFDDYTMIDYYQRYAYYLITINIVLWLISLVKSFFYTETKTENNNYFQRFNSFFKTHWVALILSFLLMVLATLSCKPDYRVLGDESILLSISQSLYETKKSFVSCSSLENYEGTKTVLVSVLDKRPIFFPYIVSVIHSSTGYRPDNIFICNFIIGFLSLFLIYYLIYLMCGRFWGINGLVCLAAYPLFIVYCTSAGFDIFNMMCSLIFFVCLYKFIKSSDAIRAELFLLWVPLLAQSRYESVLALLIALPLVFWLLPKKEYSKLGIGFVSFPLFFIAPLWLRLLTNKASDWQINNGEAVFSVEWFLENINAAITFSLSNEKAYGIIPLISIIGFIGLILFLSDTYFKKSLKLNYIEELTIREHRIYWGAFFLFYLLHAIAKFSYKLSDLRDVLATRHAIIFLPLFIIMAILFLYRVNLKLCFKRYYYSILFFLLVVVYWSNNVTSCCGQPELAIPSEFREGRNYIEANFPNKNEYVIVSDKPNFYVPLGYSSINFTAYKHFRELIRDCCKKNSNSYLLVIQLLNEDMTPFKGQEMFDDVDSEIVFEVCITKGYFYRISKCVFKDEAK